MKAETERKEHYVLEKTIIKFFILQYISCVPQTQTQTNKQTEIRTCPYSALFTWTHKCAHMLSISSYIQTIIAIQCTHFVTVWACICIRLNVHSKQILNKKGAKTKQKKSISHNNIYNMDFSTMSWSGRAPTAWKFYGLICRSVQFGHSHSQRRQIRAVTLCKAF